MLFFNIDLNVLKKISRIIGYEKTDIEGAPEGLNENNFVF